MDRLKQLRLSAGLTQAQVSAFLNISQQAYANYESGKREPDYKTLSALADYFCVSTDYLLGRAEDEPSRSLDERLRGIDFALYGEVQDMTDEEKQDVLDYIQYKKSKKERLPSDAYIAAHGGAVHASEEEKTPEAAREIFRQTRNEKNG